jgi:DNA-binding transcriptional LysR family regulator
MKGFDLHQLRIFVTVIDAGSLTAGAPRVFLSQSAASEQLRKLEERCGQALLHRSKTGVRPTPAGERLLAHARRLLAMSEEAWRDVQGQPLAGELRLDVTDYFRPAELSVLLARLGEHYPRLRLRVRIRKSDDVEHSFASGEIDIGLSMRISGLKPPTKKAVRGSARPVRRERLHWVGAPGMRRSRATPVRLLALPDSCSVHRFVVGLLKQRSIPYSVVHEASGVAGLQAALSAGLGIACLNESAMGAGLAALASPHGLPRLPDAQFHLLSGNGQGPDDALASRVAELLIEHLAS